MEIVECKRCVMNNTAQPFRVNSEGCNYCTPAILRIKNVLGKSRSDLLNIVSSIDRKESNPHGYNCVVGVSGGVDSSWLLAKAVKLGLKPLAVHMDNGWNSAQGSHNIYKLLSTLGVPLHTVVLDWHQQRRAQLAFLNANVVDVELLYDNALQEVCYSVARQYGIKTILGGNNSLSEGVEVGRNWVWHKWDGVNIRAILKKSRVSSANYPIFSFYRYLVYRYVWGIQWINLLDFIPEFGKEVALAELQRDYQYLPYGNKHFENVFTRFYQGVILPEKFGVDKRRSHLSSQIVRGEITRSEAEALLRLDIYPSRALRRQDIESICVKLGVTEAWLQDYLAQEKGSHRTYMHDPTVNYLIPLYSKAKSVIRQLTSRQSERNN